MSPHALRGGGESPIMAEFYVLTVDPFDFLIDWKLASLCTNFHLSDLVCCFYWLRLILILLRTEQQHL
jgi:hypothetical protein